MIIRFRTNRDVNGNCKYLAIDTGAESYATEPYGFIISSEVAVLKSKDLKALREQCEAHGFTRVDFM